MCPKEANKAVGRGMTRLQHASCTSMIIDRWSVPKY